ncbi:CLUMA_CG018277, isoform A [Clunio marinus]|uniref:CLUMA_CG000586, isoform A n=1 Tax=Clunio marinus TaxID=568069 RepID=A0A1J1HGS4_9DIPT|nr:CLUMA_CG000586, isoform A [Clunio marinus]CRL05405.1 CLUMA_CG018277, isoform A [Clunio marinus]
MHAATFSHIVFFSTLTPEGARMKFQNVSELNNFNYSLNLKF